MLMLETVESNTKSSPIDFLNIERCYSSIYFYKWERTIIILDGLNKILFGHLVARHNAFQLIFTGQPVIRYLK